MAYDPELAERIRGLLAMQPTLTEKEMFGGLAFLVGGYMTAVANHDGELMIRADPAESPGLVESTPATFAEMRGRQLKGWLCVDAADIVADEELSTWVDHAVDYVATLPPKR